MHGEADQWLAVVQIENPFHHDIKHFDDEVCNVHVGAKVVS